MSYEYLEDLKRRQLGLPPHPDTEPDEDDQETDR